MLPGAGLADRDFRRSRDAGRPETARAPPSPTGPDLRSLPSPDPGPGRPSAIADQCRESERVTAAGRTSIIIVVIQHERSGRSACAYPRPRIGNSIELPDRAFWAAARRRAGATRSGAVHFPTVITTANGEKSVHLANMGSGPAPQSLPSAECITAQASVESESATLARSAWLPPVAQQAQTDAARSLPDPDRRAPPDRLPGQAPGHP